MSAVPEPLTTREDRARAKRARDRRHIAISAVLDGRRLGGLAALILTSPGWPTVRETFFSWHWFSKAFVPTLKGFWLDVSCS